MSHNNQTGSSFDEKTGRWTHCFSQSFLGGLQRCPESARAEYMREVKSETTDAAATGTAVHAAIEYALTAKQMQEEIRRDDCIEVAFIELEEQRPYKKTKLTEERIEKLIPVMFDAWLRDVEPHVDPCFVELSFKRRLHEDDKRTIHLSGTIDCVDLQEPVWDWKTASRSYEVWEKQRFAVQPTVYLWEQSLNDGVPIEDIPFMYAVMLHDGSTQVFKVTRTQAHIDWLLKQCVQVAEMIESGQKPWVLNDGGWWCGPSWCSRWSECKGSVGLTEAWAQIKPKETETRAA